MQRKATTNKKRPVRHLNEVPAKVHLKSGKLRIIVEIPWADLSRRLHAELETKRFRAKAQNVESSRSDTLWLQCCRAVGRSQAATQRANAR